MKKGSLGEALDLENCTKEVSTFLQRETKKNDSTHLLVRRQIENEIGDYKCLGREMKPSYIFLGESREIAEGARAQMMVFSTSMPYNCPPTMIQSKIALLLSITFY